MAQSLVERVEAEVATLDGLDGAALRARWSDLTGQPAPGVSPKLLRLAIAWHIQAGAFGGLSNATRRALGQVRTGKTKTDHAHPGTRLVREWQGVVHVVTIDRDGTILWNDRSWTSLSAVARAITGGHWSGPAFFGLRKNSKAVGPSIGRSRAGPGAGAGAGAGAAGLGAAGDASTAAVDHADEDACPAMPSLPGSDRLGVAP